MDKRLSFRFAAVEEFRDQTSKVRALFFREIDHGGEVLSQNCFALTLWDIP